MFQPHLHSKAHTLICTDIKSSPARRSQAKPGSRPCRLQHHRRARARLKRKEGAPAEAKHQESDSDEEDARPLQTDERQYQSERHESEDTVRGYADGKSSEQYDYDDMDKQLDGMFRTADDDGGSRKESSYSYPPIPMPSYAGPSYGGRAYAGGGNI
ncbi:hypothetical protein EWM64_g7180 [Hericium alpestre]|uniref:Uncharacterized protein n=1 Tax=Hericium alpestre TaxID=135208 RepID=A0A4Y9ZPX2_9AGAM|nr:hypothetical protein EWM64_g7180 [Hericium alpestre]